MAFTKILRRALFLLPLAGCALYTDVSIAPLIVMPTGIERGSDVASMVRKADYLRAIELTSLVDGRQRRSYQELAALGSAELASGRYDAARRHLRSALDLEPPRAVFSTVAWDLAQVEYMRNNYESSLDWAQSAIDHGLNVKRWHLEYLRALKGVHVYRFSGLPSDRLPMKIGRPDVPRVDVKLNQTRTLNAVVDSGAVLSIISEDSAAGLQLQQMPEVEGTFYGLLGEPIPVHFAVLRTLELGDIVLENVPVAIMPDDKMKFLVTDKKEFNIDFLLGANLLKEFRIEMDFAREAITFTRLTDADRVPAPDQNLFIEGFRPIVRGMINRRGWFTFVLDTGSEVTFLNQAQLARLPVKTIAPKMHDATLQGLGGARKRGGRLDDIELGIDRWAGTFRTIPMYDSGDERASGILGENFLKNFRVVLDFGRMRLDLIRPGYNYIATPPQATTLRAQS
ncbi:MAG TPA: aspartyl protease family protein [Thermoanaerobaculia bacterium]|jgi:tetratricopeptide (TPR) repeat protein|nr:aspartyl protease family protein [Thermoanaerobaculia bacterium]